MREGDFVQEDIIALDAPFFSSSPTKADSMDSQQPDLRGAAYRALENGKLCLVNLVKQPRLILYYVMAGLLIEKPACGSGTSLNIGSFSDG